MGNDGDKAIIDELKKAGAPKDVIKKKAQQLAKKSTFKLLKGNSTIVDLFNAINTQWRYGVDGRMLCLDYNAVKVDIEYSGLTVKPWMWEGLKTIERTIIVEMRNGK